MKEIEFNIFPDLTEVFDEYGYLFLSIPTDALLVVIEEENLNTTGEKELDYFEERDENGFHYTPIDVEIRQEKFNYLNENPEEVITIYLQKLIKCIQKT